MVNPGQKNILPEQAYDEFKIICTNFQDESGSIDMEVKTQLIKLARGCEKILVKFKTQIGKSRFFLDLFLCFYTI